MGHLCLKKSDYIGGGVLSANRLVTFDRYSKLNVPVSMKISNPNLHVFLFCLKSFNLHINKLILSENKKTQVVFHVYKAVIAFQKPLQYAIGKATQ